MRTSRTRSPGAARISSIPAIANERGSRGSGPGGTPLCDECGDRAPEAGPVCPECPRCARCNERLSESLDRALTPEGWDAWCGAACLQDDAERWSRPARAALALELLEASAEGELDEHPERGELLGFCHSELSSALRSLLVRPRASERATHESIHWNPSELALLAGERSTDAVVERFCPECDAPVERFVDPLGGARADAARPDRDEPDRAGRAAHSEAGLCDWHAHVEALRILQRRQPARAVRPSTEGASDARQTREALETSSEDASSSAAALSSGSPSRTARSA